MPTDQNVSDANGISAIPLKVYHTIKKYLKEKYMKKMLDTSGKEKSFDRGLILPNIKMNFKLQL